MININSDLTTIKTKYDELKAYLASLESELREEDMKIVADLHGLFTNSKPSPVAAPTVVSEVAQATTTPATLEQLANSVANPAAPAVAAAPTP